MAHYKKCHFPQPYKISFILSRTHVLKAVDMDLLSMLSR